MTRLLGVELIAPAKLGVVLGLDEPPMWLVRVRVEIDGHEGVAVYDFASEQGARDMMTIADADPGTVAHMAADMIARESSA